MFKIMKRSLDGKHYVTRERGEKIVCLDSSGRDWYMGAELAVFDKQKDAEDFITKVKTEDTIVKEIPDEDNDIIEE